MPRLPCFYLPTADGKCVRGTRALIRGDGARMTCGCPRCAPWFWCRVCRALGRAVPRLIADQEPCWTVGLCVEHASYAARSVRRAPVIPWPAREEE